MALLALVAWLGAGVGASEAATPECPNEAIRIAQGATRLPDCRAYERVSPQDTTGGVVGVDTRNVPLFGAISANGDGATFGSSSAIGDAERGGALRTYNLAHRSPAGWSSFGMLTTTEPGVPMDASLAPQFPLPSADMTRMMFRTGRTLGPPNLATGSSVYLSAPEGKGPPTWLSQATPEGTQPSGGSGYPLGGSPDLSSGYLVFTSGLTSPSSGIYFFEGSTLYPAGVLPSGTVSPDGALPAGNGSSAVTSGSEKILPELAGNQVSADGSRLFFVSPATGPEPKQLYVEEGGKPGRLVSHDLLGNPAPAGIPSVVPGQSVGFALATADGSRAIFRSESALTGDAPPTGLKTYRAEITSSAVTLTYLPGVSGRPLAVDKDASTILFSTPGSVSGSSFLVWDEGRPDDPYAVATDLPSGGVTLIEPRLSEDGDVLVFASGGEVEPGVAPLSESVYTQVYRWTTQSEAAICISCRRDGGTPARFGARLANGPQLRTDNPAFPAGGQPDSSNQSTVVGNRKISSDGNRVFFDTNDPLDPARDINGVRDVYMWENGQVHLLTSGRNPVPSLILDSSESGGDVMFVTKDGLVPSDTNQTYDVYDVRVDGGFDESKAASCEGDACQGPGAGQRPAAVPGSNLLAGSGNRRDSRKGQARSRKALGVTQLGRPGSSNARVRIQVPAAGKVSIAGADVKNSSRQVKGGTVVIAVGLSQAGKQKLARKGQLRTTVRVTFRPKDGAVTRKSMTLSFASPKGAR